MRRNTPAILAAALLVALASPAAGDAGQVSFAVSFETEDGFTIHGDLVSAASAVSPVAILLHMYRSNRKAWGPLIPKLVSDGITVLAIDQRAHGESTRRRGETVRVEDIPRAEFGEVVRAGVEDVAAARAFLARRGITTDRIALIGASYGCSVALLAANRVEGVRSVVLLSPGESYFGVPVVESARAFPGAILAIASEDDGRSVEAVRTLTGKRPKPSDGNIWSRGGHGTALLANEPRSIGPIRRFLRLTLELESAP